MEPVATEGSVTALAVIADASNSCHVTLNNNILRGVELLS